MIETLRPYEAAEAVYPLAMDLADRLDEGDNLLRGISSILGEMGVVSGEFGWVEAEAERRDRLKPYLDDPRPKVAAFAQAQVRAITQSMAQEQRRAMREHEQAKRDWG